MWQRSDDYKQYLQTTNVASSLLQTALPDNAALISYSPYQICANFAVEGNGLLAFLLRREGDPVLIDLGKANAIYSSKNARTNRAADPGNANARADASRALYRKLISPILPHLAGTSDVVIAAGNDLRDLPFPALPDENGRMFGEGRSIRVITSARDILGAALAPAGQQP